jgi:hypothetical protein
MCCLASTTLTVVDLLLSFDYWLGPCGLAHNMLSYVLRHTACSWLTFYAAVLHYAVLCCADTLLCVYVLCAAVHPQAMGSG